MNLPHVKHGRVFKIKGVQIQLVTYGPLSDDAAARVAMYLWRTEATVRRSVGKLLVLQWLGDEATAKALPALARRQG